MNTVFDTIPPLKNIVVSKNEYLFHRGDNVKYLYLINSGQIRMSRLTLDGKESVMYEGSSNETFAEASLFSDNYHCDAIAVRESKLSIFDKQTFLEKLSQDPNLTSAYMEMLARQVQKLRTQIELRNIKSAHERIYQFLVLSADEKATVTLNISLKDLSRQLGLAHETFYRALSKLEKENRVQRHQDDGGLIFKI